MRPHVSSLSLSLSLSLALGATLSGQRLYVDAAAPTGGDGNSWSTAYQTLAPALARAGAGTEVWVAQGIYRGGFTVGPGVNLRGGFRSGATRAEQAQPFALRSFLDGGGTQRVLSLANAAILDGFVVQNGNAPAPGGGGAVVDGGSPTITRCVFTANRNSGGRGAALYVTNGADPIVRNCLFHANSNSAHTIDVERNAGGTFDHVTVADNPHNGLHMQDGAACVITNSIFARNGGRGLCDFSAGAVNRPSLANVLFWQNAVSLMHYRGQEFQTVAQVNNLSYAQANVAVDPGFVGGGDYRLALGAGAIDRGAGNPGTAPDAFGAPRALDGDLDGASVPDIGFHEFTHAALAVTGTPTPGNTLTFAVGGGNALAGALALGTPGGAFPLPPLGVIYGTPLVVLPLGPLPASLPLLIPTGARGDLVAQAVAVGASAGTLGNAIELRIR